MKAFEVVVKIRYKTYEDAVDGLNQLEERVEQNRIGAKFDKYIEFNSGNINEVEHAE